MALENRIYRNPRIRLATVSQRTAAELIRHFARPDATVIPNAVDLARFNLPERLRRRDAARKNLQLAEADFVLLLVGNDWKSKGLAPLLHAVAAIQNLPWRLLVVGRDNSAPFLEVIRDLQLAGRIHFHAPTPDIMHFYAAADVYTGPSLHDSFALPPLEAMACGLPVITSISNGGSQIITEGFDGFVLSDAQDSLAMSRIISRLYEQPELRRSVGENAARTAQSYSWERNASQTWEFLLGTASARSTLPVRSPKAPLK